MERKTSRYQKRQRSIDWIRRLPTVVRNPAINLINPLRISYVHRRKPLRWVTLFITNYCNARCEHCFYWDELNTKKPEMDLEQLKRVFSSLPSRLQTLRLSGGEPFLRKDLVEFYRFIDQSRLAEKMTIPSHGMLPKFVPAVRQMCAKQTFTHLNVSVSLDGMEQHHNASRKVKNGFAIAVENLRQLLALQKEHPFFNVSVSISLNREITLPGADEESEAERLIRYLREEVGVAQVGYDHIRSGETDVYDLPPEICSGFTPPPKTDVAPENRHQRTDEIQLSADEMAAVNARLIKLERDDSNRLNFERLRLQVAIKRQKQRLVNCLAGTIDCVIYPEGDVAACEFTKPFANLKAFDYNLHQLWHSEAAQARRAQIRQCSCTHPCHLSDSMAYDAPFLKSYCSPKSTSSRPEGKRVP